MLKEKDLSAHLCHLWPDALRHLWLAPRTIGGSVQRLNPRRGSACGPVLPRRRRVQGTPRRNPRERIGRGVGPLSLRARGPEARRAERLVRAAHPADDCDTRRREPSGCRARRWHDAVAPQRAGLLPAAVQRERHRQGTDRLCRLRHPRAEARIRRLRRSREGPHRPHPRARTGRTRSEEPVRRRGHGGTRRCDQEGAGRPGEGRRGRPVRHRRAQPPRPAELRSSGACLLAAAAAADRSLHPGQLGRSRAHPGRADLAGASPRRWCAGPASR